MPVTQKKGVWSPRPTEWGTGRIISLRPRGSRAASRNLITSSSLAAGTTMAVWSSVRGMIGERRVLLCLASLLQCAILSRRLQWLDIHRKRGHGSTLYVISCGTMHRHHGVFRSAVNLTVKLHEHRMSLICCVLREIGFCGFCDCSLDEFGRRLLSFVSWRIESRLLTWQLRHHCEKVIMSLGTRVGPTVP